MPEYRPDEDIERDIVDALAYDPSLNPANYRIVVVEGHVDVSGVASSPEEKRRVLSIIKRTEGVAEVHESIRVA